MRNNCPIDVVVIGGGPAGTAAALTFCHYSSLSVAVIERSNYDLPRIGEALSPGAQGLLAYLKVWDTFLADKHETSFGTSAAWGSNVVQTRDFIFSPLGTGWHLDRRRFDEMFADRLCAAGGTICRKARVTGLRRIAGGLWELGVEQEDRRFRIRARFLVDATGKPASLARKQGVRRRRMDQLVAVSGRFRFPVSVPEDTFTLIETCESGWWYSAKLPDKTVIVVLVTDADILRMGRLRSTHEWLSLLSQTENTYPRVIHGTLAEDLRIHSAQSAYAEQMVGDGWLVAGDACASHDPLSSSGIPRALDSGINAARAIDDVLNRGRIEGLKRYEAQVKEGFKLYQTTRIGYYLLEQRWPKALFWRRRHQIDC